MPFKTEVFDRDINNHKRFNPVLTANTRSSAYALENQVLGIGYLETTAILSGYGKGKSTNFLETGVVH